MICKNFLHGNDADYINEDFRKTRNYFYHQCEKKIGREINSNPGRWYLVIIIMIHDDAWHPYTNFGADFSCDCIRFFMMEGFFANKCMILAKQHFLPVAVGRDRTAFGLAVTHAMRCFCVYASWFLTITYKTGTEGCTMILLKWKWFHWFVAWMECDLKDYPMWIYTLFCNYA